jgi:prolyl-tRNA editing enzyme YbaK/EbsC (Cys-tRNA(Pro) deacylase)
MDKRLEMSLGRLHFVPAIGHPELLGPSVLASISDISTVERIGIVEIDPRFSDTAAFCAQYEVPPSQTANCVILQAKRSNHSWFAAGVVLADTRADVNGMARRVLDARKVSFASMDDAVSITDMEYGAITPLGLPGDWRLLIDKTVADANCIVIGSGRRKSKLVVSGNLLARLRGALVVEGLGQQKNAA